MTWLLDRSRSDFDPDRRTLKIMTAPDRGTLEIAIMIVGPRNAKRLWTYGNLYTEKLKEIHFSSRRIVVSAGGSDVFLRLVRRQSDSLRLFQA